MNHLLLHVGFPKTGTTTVQRWLAQHCAGRYLGKKAPGLELPSTDLFEALRKAVTKPPIWATEVWSATEVEAVAGTIERAFAEFGDVIVSDEDLVRIRPRRHIGYPLADEWEPPIVGLLRELRPRFDIRVLLTLRSQATWLPSMYSELARQSARPSQDDFERRVDRMLADTSPTGASYLDYAQWVRRLGEAVGPSNLSVLLLEEISTDGFWLSLADTAQTSWDGGEALRTNGLRNTDSWSMRPLIERAVPHVENGPRADITMPEELADRVRTHYRRSNQQLAHGIGRDYSELSVLGY